MSKTLPKKHIMVSVDEKIWKKAKEKNPSLEPKNIQAWLKDQKVVQINKDP